MTSNMTTKLATVTEGKGVALITGAARRIGREVALALAAQGHDIAIHCRDSRVEAESLAQEIRRTGRNAAVLVGELADPATVDRLVPEAVAALGTLTVLVNNASLFEDDRVGRLEVAHWNRSFSINLRAPMMLAQAMALALPPGKQGAIINISDQRVVNLTPQYFTYTLTKAALHAATTTLAQALAPHIRVNAVAPGPTIANAHHGMEGFEAEANATLLEHGANPIETAEAVAWLVKQRSITGQTIFVDGGQHIGWKKPDIVGDVSGIWR
jgi:NAD(P)-dependent dehydrogenase (short-subunit alcohol dehydrogenase family)